MKYMILYNSFTHHFLYVHSVISIYLCIQAANKLSVICKPGNHYLHKILLNYKLCLEINEVKLFHFAINVQVRARRQTYRNGMQSPFIHIFFSQGEYRYLRKKKVVFNFWRIQSSRDNVLSSLSEAIISLFIRPYSITIIFWCCNLGDSNMSA